MTMLNAIRDGKKRGTGIEGENLAAGFDGAEDTLTATVFERLFYLPDQVIAEVLLGLFGWSGQTAAIEDCLFWPRWERPDSAGFKEPDVVVVWRDPSLILVIEAKRYDFVEQQSPVQLSAAPPRTR